jgi:hypothetical protein
MNAERFFVVKGMPKDHRPSSLVYPLIGTLAASIREISCVARERKKVNCEFCVFSESQKGAGTNGTSSGRRRAGRTVEFIGVMALTEIARNEELVCADITELSALTPSTLASIKSKSVRRTKKNKRMNN